MINALKIITADPNVKAILFNIFGGITRTDDVANGIVAATRQFKVKVPIVIRLTGTNEAEAIRILEGVGMRGAERHGRGGAAGRAAGPGGRMSIFVDRSTRLVVQGITGREGSFHARQMLEYGTAVVAGVTPGKGGQKFEGRVPVFNTVADAVRGHRRQRVGHLRAADGRRRRRSSRRPTPASRSSCASPRASRSCT